MPGPEVKDWKIYEHCMKDKEQLEENKTYCAKVANAYAAGTLKHSDIPALIRYGAEQGIQDVRSSAD